MVRSCFDPNGNALVHHACAQSALGVGRHFLSSCHAVSIAIAKATTRTITKAQFLKLRLSEEDLIRPDGSLGTHLSHLKSLEDNATVVVLASARHGLCGKNSNAAKSAERVYFLEWVELHRSPTGRTKDFDGRFHGAQFHLFSKLTHIKLQSGRKNGDESTIVETAFRTALNAKELGLHAPSGSTVRTWLLEDFGIGSVRGHTSLFPHQTDACTRCSSLALDIQSVTASSKRHQQQLGDMSVERLVSQSCSHLPMTCSPAHARTRPHPYPGIYAHTHPDYIALNTYY